MRRNDLIFAKSLIAMVNPLKLLNEDTSSRVFTSNRECYVAAMKQIESLSANGYYDIKYIINHLYKLRGKSSHSVYMCYFKPLGIDPNVVIGRIDRERKEFFRKFIRAMHSYCETSFDTYQFDQAYVEFVSYIEGKPVIKSTKEMQDEKARENKTE